MTSKFTTSCFSSASVRKSCRRVSELVFWQHILIHTFELLGHGKPSLLQLKKLTWILYVCPDLIFQPLKVSGRKKKFKELPLKGFPRSPL